MNDSLSTLSAEEKLLISLCRLLFTDEIKDQTGSLMKEITDWEHFVNLANKHGIIAIVWFNIMETGNSSNIPAVHLDKLHAAYLKSLARNTFLFNHLEEILSLAKPEKIRIVLLKGLALEKTVYGNNGLRQMNDLDLLVKQGDAIRLRKILLNNGFETDPMISSIYEKRIFQYGKHLPEMRKKGISVDIHFKLFRQKGNYLTEEMIKAAISTDADANAFLPEPQLLFLYLISHLDKHEKEGSTQLRLYLDLILLLEKHYDLIISGKLFEYALETGLEIAVAQKLAILGKYWGISFPDWTSKYLEKADQKEIKEKFEWFLRHPDAEEPDSERRISLKTLREVEGVGNKLLFMIGYAFPSLRYLKFRYNSKSQLAAFLCYPFWWVKLSRLGIRGLRDEDTK